MVLNFIQSVKLNYSQVLESNFRQELANNVGKILESLSTKAKELREYRRASSPTNSQPPTPPRTPLSPNKYKSSVENMAAKFAALSAPELPAATSPSPRIPVSLSQSMSMLGLPPSHQQDQHRASLSDDNDVASPSDMSENKMSLGSAERNSLGDSCSCLCFADYHIPVSLSQSMSMLGLPPSHQQDQHRASLSDDNDVASPSDMSENKMSLGSAERNSLGGFCMI
ncbi:uncharacterized protein LOC113468631 [Diaphorina citri]|uniref:Uncharacterized protein LOC113468631 n=1 Tax=Diaphorina citri TaxID=121845 RepID=A0A3Q0J465_DIACI|nr:uncharacterized protein LOC113468631 [Diaphorina citri]